MLNHEKKMHNDTKLGWGEWNKVGVCVLKLKNKKIENSIYKNKERCMHMGNDVASW